ncbi:hypothetical protein HA466_0050120 [Hirschfeldia incana]|nr:hypothetical protein HA466_0050120 [Hirschfeldia incana]
MSVAVPILLPMDDFLVKRQDMWKRSLRFILRMTSGVVYSIVMHILIITAFTLDSQVYAPESSRLSSVIDDCLLPAQHSSAARKLLTLASGTYHLNHLVSQFISSLTVPLGLDGA